MPRKPVYILDEASNFTERHLPKRIVKALNSAGIHTLGELRAAFYDETQACKRIFGIGEAAEAIVWKFLSSVKGGADAELKLLPKRLREALGYLGIGSSEDLRVFLSEGREMELLREPLIGRKMLNRAIEFARLHELHPVSNQQRLNSIVREWEDGRTNGGDAMMRVARLARLLKPGRWD